MNGSLDSGGGGTPSESCTPRPAWSGDLARTSTRTIGVPRTAPHVEKAYRIACALAVAVELAYVKWAFESWRSLEHDLHSMAAFLCLVWNVACPFLLLAIVIGLFRRKYWAWTSAVTTVSMNAVAALQWGSEGAPKWVWLAVLADLCLVAMLAFARTAFRR